MAYATIERHGGSIDVETSPGKGTEFRLWFPTARDTIRTNNIVESAMTEGGETIHVVDDEPHLLELMETSLSHSGYPDSNGFQRSRGTAEDHS